MTPASLKDGLSQEASRAGCLCLWVTPEVGRILSGWLAINKSKASEPIRRHLHTFHTTLDVALMGEDRAPGSGGSRYRGHA